METVRQTAGWMDGLFQNYLKGSCRCTRLFLSTFGGRYDRLLSLLILFAKALQSPVFSLHLQQYLNFGQSHLLLGCLHQPSEPWSITFQTLLPPLPFTLCCRHTDPTAMITLRLFQFKLSALLNLPASQHTTEGANSYWFCKILLLKGNFLTV